MRFRKLRIAWSATWAFAYLLLPTLNPGYSYVSVRKYFITSQQHFLLAFPALLLIAAPWIPWSKRYSLRTLLIATTLVAVVLGLIVWSLR